MVKKWALLAGTIGMAMVMALAAAGCGSSTESSAGTPPDATVKADNSPVTLTFYQTNGFTEEELQRLIFDPVKKKYANISFTYIPKNVIGDDLQKMITTKDVPDILYTSPASVYTDLAPLGLDQDLQQIIKKNNFDLSRLNPNLLKGTQGPHGETYGIPHLTNPYLLYYNKSIFDKFGVAYPKDGMTWEQLRELAKKVTRSDGGVDYKGLYTNQIWRFASPYSMPFVDAKTGKANIPDKWNSVFTLAKSIVDIPGNKPPAAGTYSPTEFLKGNVAMSPGYGESIAMLLDLQKQGKGFDWDVVQYPSFSDLPNMNIQPAVHLLAIPPNSKHTDAALKAMDVLISNEAQTLLAQDAKVPAANLQGINTLFGSQFPQLKGKNIQAFIKETYAATAPMDKNDALVKKAINDAWANVFNEKMDVNTALSQAVEAANKAIDTQNTK